MKKAEKKRQLVQAVQEYMVQEELTPADLFHVVKENGADVSEATVRRIAKAEPGKENFNLDVLQRISTALFRVNATPIPVDKINSSEVAEIEGLRAVTALTDAAFQEAQEKITILEKQLAEALERLSVLSDAELKVKQLQELCEFRKQQMIEKDKQIDNLWRLIEKNEM